MWGLLKRLGSDCWGHHEWISKANGHGLWLECRECGLESAGVQLPPAAYRRTQDAADARRIAGEAPTPVAQPSRAAGVTRALRFGARRLAQGAGVPGSASAPHVATPSRAPVSEALVPTTDAERRWLQTWRAMTPEERAIAERMVAGFCRAPLESRTGRRDDGIRRDRLAG